jgi:TonB-linked SusC/RagA family outer membrane protein
MKWRVLSVLAVLALMPLAASAQQQEGLITGKVTSDAGAPVAGAQVYIEKMNLGTQTKDDGSYRIVIPAGRANGQQASLSVKLIGFKPKSVLVSLKPTTQTMDFVLGAQAVVLQQVVITGEGIMTTNEKLGETVNTVHADAITGSNESNLTNALSAKAPNVQVQSSSGDPGSSTSIQIRGLKSFSGDGQPLFVVDGVPLDNSSIGTDQFAVGNQGQGVVTTNRIADVNPNDIESVTILKGAAAAAIYGARASQGVVLITTKSGKSGQTRYSLTSSLSLNQVTQGYPLQTTYGEGANGVAATCNATSLPGSTDGGSDCLMSTARSWGPAFAAGTTTYDHFGEMFVTGTLWDNILSMSGGDDRRSFYFSAGYTANAGDVTGNQNDYNRATFKLKGSQMITDQMQISANFNYVNVQGTFIQRGDNIDGIMLGSLRTPGNFNNFVYLDSASGLQRSYRYPNPSAFSTTTSRGFDNPIWVANAMPATQDLNRFYGNFMFNWTPEDFLTIQWTPGVDYYADQRLEAFPQTSSGFPSGQIFRTDMNSFIVSSLITVIGSHTFNPNFSGTLTLGNELNSQQFNQNFVQGFTLITPQPYTISNTVSWFPNDDETLVHRQSYFAQATADLWDQLYLTLAIRNDGFSTFAQNDPRAWYPKASAAWTFTKTTGTKDWLQYGKVRAAYGETGKEPAPYSTLSNYQVNKIYEYGGVGFLNSVYEGIPGLTSSTRVGNDQLHPERSKEWEAGFDLGFFNGMSDLSFSYYNSKTNDVIFQVPLPPSSGYQSQVQNGATISNKGYEVQLNFNSQAQSKLQWSLGLLWAQNRNNVDAINGASIVFLPNSIVNAVAIVGSPVGSIYGYDFYRCGKGETVAGVDIDNTPTSGGGCGTGYAKNATYIGANGFPIVNTDSNLPLGSAQPNWTGAIRGSITPVKNLQFSFLFDIRNGSQAYNGTRGALYVYGTHRDTDVRHVDRSGRRGRTGRRAGRADRCELVPGRRWFLRQQHRQLRGRRRIHQAP